MQIQLPGFIFRSLKTGPQTPVQHDKSLRSSHFSTKTIQQCVDSALPPLPTFVAAGCLVLRLGRFIDCWRCACCRWWFAHKHTHTHRNAHYISMVWDFMLLTSEVELPCAALIKASPLIVWTFHFSVAFTSDCMCRNNHHPAGNGVTWNGSDHYLKAWPHLALCSYPTGIKQRLPS